MKAIFTTTMWLEVADNEEAAKLCGEMDKANYLNLEAIFERAGLEVSAVTGELGYCGTSFWLVDETRVVT
jgi:hypothetical protein